LSENRTTARIIAFAACYAVGFLYLNSGGGDTSIALILGAVLGLIGYFVVGLWIIAPIIEKILDAKSRSDYEIQTTTTNESSRRAALEAEREAEERVYFQRKRELELEFEHLEKIMRLQSNLDQGKMDRLAQMQNQFRSNKLIDLNSMKAQIDAMRK
jgi:hypothetical protein